MEKKLSVVWLAARLVENANGFLKGELAAAGYRDISTSQGDIFAALFRKDGQAVSELARATRRTKSTVSVMVDKLSASGYVEKRSSAEDSRAVGVWLTEKGRAFEDPLMQISARMNEKLAGGFRDHELAALTDFLMRCNENLTGEKDFTLKW